jgi:hypothetical protein
MIELYNIDRAKELADHLAVLRALLNSIAPNTKVRFQQNRCTVLVDEKFARRALHEEEKEIIAKLEMLGVSVK